MVLVVVCQDHSLDGIARDAVAPQLVKHALGVDTSVDEHSALRCADVGAVATAATAETDKGQPLAQLIVGIEPLAGLTGWCLVIGFFPLKVDGGCAFIETVISCGVLFHLIYIAGKW